MFNHVLLMIFFVILSLHAEPSLSQIQQAVIQNPALLNSPQAKAMMKKKGITSVEVKQHLSKDKIGFEQTNTKNISNDIVTTVEKKVLEKKNIEKVGFLEKRVNPFFFRTDEIIRKELSSKQQLSSSKLLKRYSSSFYLNQNSIDSASLPTPDNYIVSTGDSINIHIYGDRDQNYLLNVSNNGSIDLQYIGPVKIGGMKFKDAKNYLMTQLKSHFNMSQFNITMNKYSTIQVTLVGEVKNPGLYNLSSFSTVKDLLIVAKGIRNNASVREIIIKRDSKILKKLDFYDLLFMGKEFNTTLLRHGDVVVIKKAQTLVSIDGYVNTPAIFELKSTESLNKLIEYAGGMKPNASKLNIKVDRYSQNSKFETFKISYKNAKIFKMKDGDKVYIYPLDFTAKKSISIHGSVIRPGNYRLSNEKTLNTFLKHVLKGGLKSFFLPETYFQYGVIKRYSNDLTYSSHSFNLLNVIEGREVIAIKPNDQLYIFSQNDIYANAYITTKGKILLNPGKLQYFKGITIRDVINAAGIGGVVDDNVKVVSYDKKSSMPRTFFYSLKKEGNKILNPYDEVEVFDFYEKHTLEPVVISGEVINPTTTFYEKGMTLQKLLNIANGFNKKAYTKSISIVRYYTDKNQNREQKILNFDLTKRSLNSIKLQPYDEVKVFTIPNWGEKRTIVLKGEVKFPGKYTIARGEKLSSVLKRAGGFTHEAFINGAVFTRESIRVKQIKHYNNALAKIKRELSIYNSMPANARELTGVQQTTNSLDDIIVEAKKYQPIGRISIELDENLTLLSLSDYDLVLKNKDTLTIPTKVDTVTVFGEVFNPSSFVYNREYSSSDYIKLASGLSRTADNSNIYVIHADGRSEPIDGGWFSSGADIEKGDTIVVPLYIKETNQLDVWDSVSKILASFALTAAAVNSLGVI